MLGGGAVTMPSSRCLRRTSAVAGSENMTWSRREDRRDPLSEFHRSDNLLRKIAGDRLLNGDGTLTAPEYAGIGVDLTREMVEPFTRNAWPVELDWIA
jgi:hypothetical protein